MVATYLVEFSSAQDMDSGELHSYRFEAPNDKSAIEQASHWVAQNREWLCKAHNDTVTLWEYVGFREAVATYRCVKIFIVSDSRDGGSCE